jgi:hypothetical protein
MRGPAFPIAPLTTIGFVSRDEQDKTVVGVGRLLLHTRAEETTRRGMCLLSLLLRAVP